VIVLKVAYVLEGQVHIVLVCSVVLNNRNQRVSPQNAFIAPFFEVHPYLCDQEVRQVVHYRGTEPFQCCDLLDAGGDDLHQGLIFAQRYLLLEQWHQLGLKSRLGLLQQPQQVLGRKRVFQLLQVRLLEQDPSAVEETHVVGGGEHQQFGRSNCLAVKPLNFVEH
jgi:hypothetical protein